MAKRLDPREMVTNDYLDLCRKVVNWVVAYMWAYGGCVTPSVREIAGRFGITEEGVLLICEDTGELDYTMFSGYQSNIADYFVEPMTDELWELIVPEVQTV